MLIPLSHTSIENGMFSLFVGVPTTRITESVYHDDCIPKDSANAQDRLQNFRYVKNPGDKYPWNFYQAHK